MIHPVKAIPQKLLEVFSDSTDKDPVVTCTPAGAQVLFKLFILKLFLYMHIVGLCMPVDFKPVFVAGAPARELGTGSSEELPGYGTPARGGGSRVPCGAPVA